MGDPTDRVPSRSATLSMALRGLRRRRGLSPGQVADAMGMPRRSFEYFEAGRGKLNVDRIHQVAQILDADPYAILAAIEIRSPAFAIRCAEHKLMTVFMIALQEFDAVAKDNIARLNPATIISGFTRIFDALAKEGQEGETFRGAWMSKGEDHQDPQDQNRQDGDHHDDRDDTGREAGDPDLWGDEEPPTS